MKLAIAAGGTGGHIYPGLALAAEVKRCDPRAEILFVGTPYGLENELVTKEGFRLELISGRTLFKSFIGFFQGIWLLGRFRPGAVISTGGYASLPLVLAAWLLRIPIYLHEQNVLPGKTNRLCARLARKVFLSFPETKKYLAGEVVGNPVRREIVDEPASAQADWTVLVMGGSQGARRLNEAVIASVTSLPPGVKIIHLIGQRDFELFHPAPSSVYQPVPYAYNIAQYLAAADLVVSRAGATAIAEFLVRGLPMVLVPYPHAAEDHQTLNAEVIARADAGLVVPDREFSADRFMELLRAGRESYDKMKENARRLARPDAAERIIEQIYG